MTLGLPGSETLLPPLPWAATAPRLLAAAATRAPGKGSSTLELSLHGASSFCSGTTEC